MSTYAELEALFEAVEASCGTTGCEAHDGECRDDWGRAEAATLARVTGSRAATVTHERRMPDGSLIVEAVSTYVHGIRCAHCKGRHARVADVRACSTYGNRPR